MKKNIILYVAYASILFYTACKRETNDKVGNYTEKKGTQRVESNNVNHSKAIPFSVVFPNNQGTLSLAFDKISQGVNDNAAPRLWAGCSVEDYDIYLDCYNPVLNLTRIVFFGTGDGPQLINGIRIGGVWTFDLEYVGSEGPFGWTKVYRCLNVPLYYFPTLNYCNSAATLQVEFYNPGCLEENSPPSECDRWEAPQILNMYMNSIGSCSASVRPNGTLTGTSGELRVILPDYSICLNCSPAWSPYYVCRIRLVGTSNWTYQVLSHPNYLYSGFLFTGLPSGLYEIQGQNVCSSSPPFNELYFVEAWSNVQVP